MYNSGTFCTHKYIYDIYLYVCKYLLIFTCFDKIGGIIQYINVVLLPGE